MKDDDTTIVIGAGPYGISVAAHLKARGIPTLVLGKPMEFWQNMPTTMYLKSVWSASSLSDPAGKYRLNRYLAATNTSRQEPISLPFFIQYGQWFQQNTVPDIDPTYVQCLTRDGKHFHLDLADGRTIKASKVIVATGIVSFTSVWLQQRVEGHVRLTPNTQIVKAVEQGQGLHIELSDGTAREIDYLLLGTGYRPNVDKLEFIDHTLRQQIQKHNGYPIQNKWFESSVPHLYFAGALGGTPSDRSAASSQEREYQHNKLHDM